MEQKGGGDGFIYQKEPNLQDQPLMIDSRTNENFALIDDPLVALLKRLRMKF